MKYKENLINSIISTLNSIYFNENNSLLVSKNLKKILKNTSFINLNNKEGIADFITKEIQLITKDSHLKLRYSPDDISSVKDISKKDEILHHEKTNRDKYIHNFGFKRLEFFDNGIGYLKLTRFSDINISGETVFSAMRFLSNSRKIIIDIRDNEGGHPSMVQLLISYFSQAGTEICTFYYPKLNKLKQMYSLDYVQGERLLDKEIIILINKNTFSAGEAFAYSMKSLGKAKIIGENSKGGANICSREIINDDFILIVPIGYPEDFRTKSNWELTGVIPDEINLKINLDELIMSL